MLIENIMNPPEKVKEVEFASLTRYTFNLKTKNILGFSLPIGMRSELSRYVNQLEFPTINEAYRGKKVNNL